MNRRRDDILTTRQPANPTAPEIDTGETVFEIFRKSAGLHASRIALARRSAHDSTPVSYSELLDEVRAFAAGLWQLGLRRGDRIALIGENDARWLVADLAVLSIGAIDVPRGLLTDRDELRYILEHSGCRLAIVQEASLAEEIASGRFASGAKIGPVVQSGSAGSALGPGVIGFDAVLARGRSLPTAERRRFRDAESSVGPDDLATLVYTSGTTGCPKGVMLTHRNIACNIRMVPLVLDITEQDRFLSILPTWHMFERTLEYIALSRGASIVYTSKKRLRDDLASEGITLLGSVPRVWESFHDAIEDAVASRPLPMRALIRAAIALGRAELQARLESRGCIARFTIDEPPSGTLAGRARHAMLVPFAAVADRLVFRRLRQALGGRLRFAINGGASLAERLDVFFNAIRVPLLNGYGLTETAPIVSVRTPDRNVLGTIGRPVPGTEVRIADEAGRPVPPGEKGLIWIRGPQVMPGYYRSPDETARVITEDGWFNSGDLGRSTLGGELVITGREKDTIVLLSGENVEPQPIEDRILQSALLHQAIVVGQDRKHLAALIVPDVEALAEALGRASSVGLADLVRAPGARDAIRSEIDRLTTAPSRSTAHLRIVDFRLLPREFSIEDGTITPTLKLKRNVVAVRYAELIAEMYEGSSE